MAALNRAETQIVRTAIAVLETIERKPQWAASNVDTVKKVKEELRVVLTMKGHYDG
jgi:hypothetical protein